MTNPTPTEPKKKGWFRRSLPYTATGVGALIIGVMMGSAGGGTETVVETKTVEVEVADPTCLQAAEEYRSILQSTINDIVIPQNEIMTAMPGAILSFDDAAINEMTDRVVGITDRTYNLTEDAKRANTVFEECQR